MEKELLKLKEDVQNCEDNTIISDLPDKIKKFDSKYSNLEQKIITNKNYNNYELERYKERLNEICNYIEYLSIKTK